MWLREMKRFIRNRSRLVGALGQPILFLLALGFGFGAVFKAAGQGDYMQFLAPGVIGMSIIFGSVFNGMSLIWDRQFGFLKETLAAPVSRFSIMFGRTLGGATTSAFQGVVVLVITLFVGFRPHSLALVPAAILVMLLAGLLFSAFGLMFGSLFEDFQGFQLVMNFLVMPLFFFSGSIFPLNSVPTALLWIARFDPLTYAIDAIRFLLVGATDFSIGLDLAVISVMTLIFVSAGSYLFSRIQV